MLEASRMDRTDVTQGDLEELCESGLGGNMRQEDVSFLPTYHRFDSPYASILEPTNNRRGLNLTNRPATDSSFNPGLLGLPSPSSDLHTPGEGSAHTPASVESASRTLTGFNISNIFFILLHIFFGSNLVRSGNAYCSPINSAQRVGFFNIGSGRVLNKIPGSGSGSGRSVEKYDRVFPGIFVTFGYYRVFRVFSGISGFTHIY